MRSPADRVEGLVMLVVVIGVLALVSLPWLRVLGRAF